MRGKTKDDLRSKRAEAQCFLIKDVGSASEASSRRVGETPEASSDGRIRESHASLTIDPMNILGEEGGRSKSCGGVL